MFKIVCVKCGYEFNKECLKGYSFCPICGGHHIDILKKRIAILFTTFLRDTLAYQTITSIVNNWNPNYGLLIGDQGHITQAKEEWMHNLIMNNLDKPIKYIKLPFDCGLSGARNALVLRAQELGINYCFLTADSIEFTSSYNLDPIIDFLEADTNRGIVGFNLKNRIAWEYNLNLIDGIFKLSFAGTQNEVKVKDIVFNKVDICRNFYLAKTQTLLFSPYDAELKICEHEDWFWRLKTKTTYQTYFTNYIEGLYIDNKPNEYKQYRNRMYSIYRDLLKKKYNLKGWVQMPPKK